MALLKLHELDNIKDWYYINPFINDGYRKPTSPLKAFLSVFQWHNETLNIYSHFLPALFWTYMFFSSQNEADAAIKYMISYSYFAAASMGFASAFAHTFYIVNKRWAIACWKIDYLGIIAINMSHQFLDTFILFYRYWPLFYMAICIELIFAAFCIKSILMETTTVNWGLVYPVITSTVLTVPSLAVSYYKNSQLLQSLAYYSVGCSTFIFIAGGVFFLGKVPERFWNPNGIFNNYNSHFFHHICIVISIYFAFNSFSILHLLSNSESKASRIYQS